MGGAAKRPEEELEALRAEVATLRSRLELTQGAIDALPFPLFWKDKESIYAGANREQAVRSGFSGGPEVVGLSDHELPWMPEEAGAFRADDRRVMSTGEPLTAIIETQRLRGGGERLCRTHKSPLRDAEGQVIGVVGWYEDVTDSEGQRRAHELFEERLRNAHKRDSLGTLAGGIAHDFNNILASIMGNLWLVQQTIGSEHSAAESLADIHRAGLRAKRLVERLLVMKEKQPRQLGPVALGDVVLEACRLLRPIIPAGVELTTDIDPAAPAVLGDATQLHQVVVDLCTNAWLAITDRLETAPRVAVRVAALDLGPDEVARLPGHLAPGVFVVLSVGDNGVGMDAATRRRIFEPFFTTREVGSGTGLGLSVVQGIVTAHHGVIEVQSAPGEGSTLRVYFPSSSVPSTMTTTAPVSVRTTVASSSAKHVLYVDDERAVLRVVRRLLEREGCRVSTFSDPRDASAALRAQIDEYDILVVDFSMPHLSGLDLAREVAALRPALPVVLISGVVTADLRREAARAGVQRILDKVDVATQLREAVRALVVPRP